MNAARRLLSLASVITLLAGSLAGCGGGSGGGSGTTAAGSGNSSGVSGSSASTGSTTASPTASPTVTPPASPGGSPTATPPSSPGTYAGPTVEGCPVFPLNNPWNQDISTWPVDPASASYLSRMNAGSTNLHPDFGTDPTYGIPYVVVAGTQPLVPVDFTAYPTESDPGPYPIPPGAPIEGGSNSTGDRHVLVVDKDHAMLYEMAGSIFVGPGWNADCGARFDLTSNALRPDYWTSADAAGLPIFAGLARYDECAAGAIRHALRFTVQHTQDGFIHPATHFASSITDPTYPPMGLRVRLQASFDTSAYSGAALVILTALKHYGMMVADNGSNFYITGAPDPRWDDTNLDQLKTVPGSAFEVVTSGPIVH